jgi:hypothetical protein
MPNLHFNHLDMAWLALDIMEKAGDEYEEFADRIAKAKVGIEAEMDRRQARNKKKQEQQARRAQLPDLDRLLEKPSHDS